MSSATKPVEQKARELLETVARIVSPHAWEAWRELVVDYGQGQMGWTEAEAIAYAGQAHKSYRDESNWPLALEKAEAIIAALNTDGERIRREAFEEAAKVAEDRFSEREWNPLMRNAGLGIASAIRSLSTPSKGVG